MTNMECEQETHLRRMSGWIIVTIGLYVATAMLLFKAEIGVLSIVGFMFSITLIGLGGTVVISPESEDCRQVGAKR